MADNKDFLLGNKARELLCYTKHATKVVSDDASRRDVRMILYKIAQLEDIREVQKVCGEAVQMIDRSSREGFTKSNFRLYGEDMRVIAKASCAISSRPTIRTLLPSQGPASERSTMCWTTAHFCWNIFSSASMRRSST